ncbi:hypothetical protein SERLA73DRAFT_167981, partial [Serpula lacrymans var. lacrymans S7.3]
MVFPHKAIPLPFGFRRSTSCKDSTSCYPRDLDISDLGAQAINLRTIIISFNGWTLVSHTIIPSHTRSNTLWSVKLQVTHHTEDLWCTICAS